MPNPRKPAAARQSRRLYSVPKPKSIPAYPPGLSAEAHPVFAELCESMPDGAAAKSDSIAIALAAELLAQFRQDPIEFSSAKLSNLRLLLGELAMTPKARRQLELKPEEAENPFAEVDRLRRL